MRSRPAFRSKAIWLPLVLLLAGAAPGPPQISPHEKAARELYRLMGGADLAMAGAESMKGMFRLDPEAAHYNDVFREWYRKVFAADDLEKEMVNLYMETFSEKELREIAAFYRTPAGRKAIAMIPELMKKGTEVGMRRVQEHGPELEAMLEKAREEREKLPAATDEEAQKRTIAHIRNTGTAMFSWLTDQVGAAAAGASQIEETSPSIVELDRYPLISHEDLEKLLLPQYIQRVPETDGWGHPFEYYLNAEDPMAPQVMGIRSPGRDGKFSTDDYTVSAFDPDNFDEDIAWADGFFVRWPQKVEVSR